MMEDTNGSNLPTMSQWSFLLRMLFKVECHTLKFVGPVSIISLNTMESKVPIFPKVGDLPSPFYSNQMSKRLFLINY